MAFRTPTLLNSTDLQCGQRVENIANRHLDSSPTRQLCRTSCRRGKGRLRNDGLAVYRRRRNLRSLWSPPAASGLVGGSPPRRLPFLCRCIARRGTATCVQTHLLFSKGQCRCLLAFTTPLQKSPAQQREFLYADAIFPCKSEICSDGVLVPSSIRRRAFKCKHAESGVLLESYKTELHLSAPFGNSVPTRSSFCCHSSPCTTMNAGKAVQRTTP
jgi:hypothetical protein